MADHDADRDHDRPAERDLDQRAGERHLLEALAHPGELGLVRPVSTPRGHTVYDARTEPHHHLVCRRYGRVEDVDGAIEADEVEAAARAAGFRPERAEVQLSGLCRECAA